jgi:hypothetical protein
MGEMDMGVDQTGKDQLAAGIINVSGLIGIQLRADAGHL